MTLVAGAVRWPRQGAGRRLALPTALLLIGGALAGCTGGAPAGAGPTPSRGSGSLVVAPDPLRWTECPLPADKSAVVRSVTAGGDGVPWTAVGQERDSSGVLPAVWTAADGCAWRRVPIHPITPDGEDTGFTAVVRRGRTLAALGAGSSAVHGNTRPTLWRATAAGPLTEVKLLRELFGPPNGISVVTLAATPSTFLATGGYLTPDHQPAVQLWRSADGATWLRPVPSADQVSTDAEQFLPRDLVGGPAGALLVGMAWEISNGLRDGADAAVWYADGDGRDWHRGRFDAALGLTGLGDQRLVAATWLGPGYVVVAAVPADGGGLALRSIGSRDGRTWTAGGPLPLPQSLPGPDVPAVRLARTPGGGLVAGTAAGGKLLLWRSESGATWTPESPPGRTDGATGFATAATADRLALIVGTPAGVRAYAAS